MKGIIRSVVFAAGLSMAGAAMADPNDIKVRYSPSDLRFEEGRAAVYKELRRAAEAACGPTDLRKAGSVYNKRKNEICVSDSLDRLVEVIDHQELTRLHRKSGIVLGD